MAPCAAAVSILTVKLHSPLSIKAIHGPTARHREVIYHVLLIKAFGLRSGIRGRVGVRRAGRGVGSPGRGRVGVRVGRGGQG